MSELGDAFAQLLGFALLAALLAEFLLDGAELLAEV